MSNNGWKGGYLNNIMWNWLSWVNIEVVEIETRLSRWVCNNITNIRLSLRQLPPELLLLTLLQNHSLIENWDTSLYVQSTIWQSTKLNQVTWDYKSSSYKIIISWKTTNDKDSYSDLEAVEVVLVYTFTFRDNI